MVIPCLRVEFLLKTDSWYFLSWVVKTQLRDVINDQGSVLAQMSFPLHASEISDKSEMGKKKLEHVSVPAESSHLFLFKKVSYRRRQNVTFFGKDVTKKRHKLKKIFSCVRASHSSQKCDKCNASHFWSPKKVQNVTSLTGVGCLDFE